LKLRSMSAELRIMSWKRIWVFWIYWYPVLLSAFIRRHKPSSTFLCDRWIAPRVKNGLKRMS
jgi:Bor protein.